jgi:hypothetical protein
MPLLRPHLPHHLRRCAIPLPDLQGRQRAMTNIEKIRRAYEHARLAENKARGERAPAWEDLSLAVREAIIDVFFAGRRDGMENPS